MNPNTENFRGLTRLIVESLVEKTAEMAACGETWSPELLDKVEEDLRQHLAPPMSQRRGLIFDMVFRRSFAEAKELILSLTSFNYPEKENQTGLGRHAMA